jgi:hypothetical protein
MSRFMIKGRGAEYSAKCALTVILASVNIWVCGFVEASGFSAQLITEQDGLPNSRLSVAIDDKHHHVKAISTVCEGLDVAFRDRACRTCELLPGCVSGAKRDVNGLGQFIVRQRYCWNPPHRIDPKALNYRVRFTSVNDPQCTVSGLTGAQGPAVEMDTARRNLWGISQHDRSRGQSIGSQGGFDPCGSSCYGISRGDKRHARYSSLHYYCLQSAQGIRSAKGADQHQDASEDDIGVVPPIRRYRHGGQFGDSYGFLCICSGWVLAGCLYFVGAGCLLDRRCAIGWSLIGLGTLFNILATASGWIGCLPWNWRGCLQDGQEHCQTYKNHDSDHSIPRWHPIVR